MCNHIIALLYRHAYDNEDLPLELYSSATYSEVLQFINENIENLTEQFSYMEVCKDKTFYEYCKNGKKLRKFLFQKVEVLNFCPNCGKQLKWGVLGNKLNIYIDNKIKDIKVDFVPTKELTFSKQEKDNNGYVYIVKAENYYKIGMTRDINNRLRSYTEMPYEIQDIYYQYVENYINIEKYLHKHFQDKRIRREWFTLNDNDIEFIKQYLNKYKAINNK